MPRALRKIAIRLDIQTNQTSIGRNPSQIALHNVLDPTAFLARLALLCFLLKTDHFGLLTRVLLLFLGSPILRCHSLGRG